ncbi:putative entry exclusion protein TrbK-alt [Paracoccus kondratievae]|uniref:putative entry exclusion protein TrbK-alt n=1 Tax=Paracoccus kondratievae TaxID=135740 RepID=UPI0012664261|nr:putative entry exclusion protein TrbK-alt [Paracoccus kondratievae]QFQ88831.1 putative entry exclusion protein TrbK-alt [Paracoccus kondratievae]
MEGKTGARIVAIMLAAVALTAALVSLIREAEGPVVRAVLEARTSEDPLRQDLRRCQQLGNAALEDDSCRAAWAQSRDRFLGRERAQTAAPNVPDASATSVEGR